MPTETPLPGTRYGPCMREGPKMSGKNRFTGCLFIVGYRRGDLSPIVIETADNPDDAERTRKLFAAQLEGYERIAVEQCHTIAAYGRKKS